MIDCASYSSVLGLNTWVYDPGLDTCQLGTLTHVVLTDDEGIGITAGVPSDLPIARWLLCNELSSNRLQLFFLKQVPPGHPRIDYDPNNMIAAGTTLMSTCIMFPFLSSHGDGGTLVQQ